ncbi:sigma-70 family RNA polymerase sigma factor [soil metagenome]
MNSFFNSVVDLDRLLARCRNHDTAAWEQLVDHLQRLVYSIPRRYGLSADDSSDVFQETFFALYKNLDRIENGRSLIKWVAVTASREALRIKKLSQRSVSTEFLDLDEMIASEDASVEADAVKSELAFSLRMSVDRMGKRCRELLTALYFDEAESYEEVSSKIGIPTGAIGPTRSRCLEKLRKDLERQNYLDEMYFNDSPLPSLKA